MYRRYLGALLIVGYLTIGNALECYVCTKQAGNVAKCLKSIEVCDQAEDVCLTEVRWGSAPYWTSGGQKQFYVSKRCATKQACEKTKKANMKLCSMLWYQDWTCSDCCVGDRCNYFIFSSGNRHTISLSTLLMVTVTSLFGAWTMQ